jgi:putative flippase GtrA
MRAQLFWFGVAGVIGLLVDTGVLYALAPLFGWYLGRVLSFWAAASFTWWFNRRLTFRAGRATWTEYGRYLSAMLGGATLNYLTYVLVLHNWHGQGAALLGVALGSVAGMGVNFLAARYLLFSRRASQAGKNEENV